MMRRKHFRILCLLLLILYVRLNNCYRILDLITRMEKSTQTCQSGDTLEIGWQYHLDFKTRKETLEIFYCGYKDKITQHMMPLAFSVDGEHFHSVKANTIPSQFGIKVRSARKYVDKIEAYKNTVRNAFYLKVQPVTTDFKNLEIMCVLNYKTTFSRDSTEGGLYTIMVAHSQPKSKSRKLASPRVGTIFLAALIFDVVLFAGALVASTICRKRIQHAYQRVSKKDDDQENKIKSKSKKKLSRPQPPQKSVMHSERKKSAAVTKNENIHQNDATENRNIPEVVNTVESKKPNRPPPPLFQQGNNDTVPNNAVDSQNRETYDKAEGESREEENETHRSKRPRNRERSKERESKAREGGHTKTREGHARRSKEREGRSKTRSGGEHGERRRKERSRSPKTAITSGGFGTPSNPRLTE